MIAKFFQTLIFIVIGIPSIVVATGETLIFLNDLILTEKLPPLFATSEEHLSTPSDGLQIPGPKYRPLQEIPYSQSEEYHQFLLEKFAPVILQKVSIRPAYDIPVFIDYDNNLDPRDNVKNLKNHPLLTPGIHAEVTAETEDSFYLLYCLFHIADYDYHVREILFPVTAHDGDNEGIMVRVDKKTMLVTEAEGWFHNRFFYTNTNGQSNSNEPVRGKNYFESKTHLIVYAPALGHGVRSAQPTDMPFIEKNIKILRFRGEELPTALKPNRSVVINGLYDMKNFDDWYKTALGPLGKKGRGEGMFEDAITLGRNDDGTTIKIGWFIGTFDYRKKWWVRAKPPWAWDDTWDNIPIAVWHFIPSVAFQSHFGLNLSHNYISNRPVEKIFNLTTEELKNKLSLNIKRGGGSTWKRIKNLDHPPDRKSYWRAAEKQFKTYVNRIMGKLG